jgi:hypothetical protein
MIGRFSATPQQRQLCSDGRLAVVGKLPAEFRQRGPIVWRQRAECVDFLIRPG